MIILRGLHGPHRPRLCSYRVTALRRRCQAAAAVAGPGSAIDSSRVASRVGSEGSGPGRRCQAGQHVTARTRHSNTDNVATSAYARSAVTRRAPALSWSLHLDSPMPRRRTGPAASRTAPARRGPPGTRAAAPQPPAPTQTPRPGQPAGRRPCPGPTGRGAPWRRGRGRGGRLLLIGACSRCTGTSCGCRGTRCP